MVGKIKEFKGSLNPIFSDDAQTSLEIDPELHTSEQTHKDILFMPISQIISRKDQPRKMFDESSLDSLAQSIKSKGIIQPIIVQSAGNGLYEIIAGERRWRAAKKAGLEKIPAIIRDYNKSDIMAVALIENIQRENLNPLEEAQAIQDLVNECSMTHSQVAESIGKSRTAVSNLLRLLSLTSQVKTMINANLLEMGHARALLSLTEEQQIEAAKLVVNKSLSVRETEKLVQRMNSSEENQAAYLDPVFKNKVALWKKHLAIKLSSKVDINFNTKGKGRVVIHFDSVEEADWLMDHIDFTETIA